MPNAAIPERRVPQRHSLQCLPAAEPAEQRGPGEAADEEADPSGFCLQRQEAAHGLAADTGPGGFCCPECAAPAEVPGQCCSTPGVWGEPLIYEF